MILFQITLDRLRTLDQLWGRAFNGRRGPVPRSLGLCHMLAETDGNNDPVTRDTIYRTVGIMRLKLQDALRLGYDEVSVRDAHTNIYAWCKLANQYAKNLHQQFPTWWSQADLDFWLGVRLALILGPVVTENLLTAANSAGTDYRSTNGVQAWIRTLMRPTQHFGINRQFDLLRIADHLDQVLLGMQQLDGPNYVSTSFSEETPSQLQTESELYRRTTAFKPQRSLV